MLVKLCRIFYFNLLHVQASRFFSYTFILYTCFYSFLSRNTLLIVVKHNFQVRSGFFKGIVIFHIWIFDTNLESAWVSCRSMGSGYHRTGSPAQVQQCLCRRTCRWCPCTGPSWRPSSYQPPPFLACGRSGRRGLGKCSQGWNNFRPGSDTSFSREYVLYTLFHA